MWCSVGGWSWGWKIFAGLDNHTEGLGAGISGSRVVCNGVGSAMRPVRKIIAVLEDLKIGDRVEV